MSKKIVVVEDDRKAQQELRAALSAAGYSVITLEGPGGIARSVCGVKIE